MPTHISVVLPAYNEAENLVEVIPEITDVLDQMGKPYQVLVVDDGSTDGTREIMAGLRSSQVGYVRLRANAGKSAALSVGFERADGDFVILMDADGQDDPHEIPRLLEALDGGLDLVTGSRAGHRQDRFIKRNTSKIYNWTTSKVSGVEGRDFNSGLKAMRREVMGSLDLYGELHRYIPVLAAWGGFRVGEVPVAHHERRHGTTKFGGARFWRGFLDLITVKFLTTYNARPFHFFGGVGALFGVVGSGLLVWMLVEKVLGHAIGTRPALVTGVLLVIVSVQFLSFGLLAELMVHLGRRRSVDAVVDVNG
ncbi:MAG TPA: glycosyltransferase family 2 protein [Acidimicrobiales bacterium]|jgi:dolichol-phosphate mannosyltransferase|nr:glycosyltransferase family 2 protein [Acidimicrobiales bacterium]